MPNATRSRVLLALAGQARTFHKTAPRLFALLVRPNEPHFEFDIYINTELGPPSCATSCEPFHGLKARLWKGFSGLQSATELTAQLRAAYDVHGQLRGITFDQAPVNSTWYFAMRTLHLLQAARADDGQPPAAAAAADHAFVRPYAFCILARLDVVLTRALPLLPFAHRLQASSAWPAAGTATERNGLFSVTSSYIWPSSHDHERDTDYMLLGSARCLAMISGVAVDPTRWGTATLDEVRVTPAALARLRRATGLKPGRPWAAMSQNYSRLAHRRLLWLRSSGCGLDVGMFANAGIFAHLVRPGGVDALGAAIEGVPRDAEYMRPPV